MPWLLQIHTRLTPDNCLVRFPGIYEVKIFGANEAVYGETDETIVTLKYPGVPQVHPDIIGSARLGANELSQVDTDTEVFSTFGAFRYNYDRGAILINAAKYSDGVAVEGYQAPYGQRLAIGIIVGYCDTVDYTREDKSTYNGIFHDTRIKALPTLSAKMDDLEYGFQVFNDWTVTLLGTDGAFEGVNHTGIIAKILSLPEGGELKDAKTAAAGRITKTTDGDDFTITVGDIKRNFENVASCGRFTKELFPYLDDGDAGRNFPIYWNKQTGIEPVCVNKLEDLSDSPTSMVKYCIGATPDSAHTIKRVDRVYTVGTDENTGEDVETDITQYVVTLYDATAKMAFVSIPASIAYDDAPIDIKVDLFGWSNQATNETEWLNGADIIRDAIVMFGGYRYEPENFDLQSWEIERVKCAAKGIHVSPRIEDDTTINDIIGQVAKSTLMLCTSRPDGRFDLKVDSFDVYPEWQIESFHRMETPSPAIDLSQAFSSLKIQYGTAGDSDKKTYLDTTHEADIQSVTDVRRVKEIDTIISDAESAKQYAVMVYERIFDLDTYQTRPLIEIKVPMEAYLINICPTKAFLAPRTRDGSKWAAYTVTAVSRALGDEQITVTGRWRYDIEFDQTYTQGVICDDFICDGAVIGATTIDAA